MSNPQRLYDLIRQVRPLYWTLYRAVEDGLSGSGLTVGDRAVLECLHDLGPSTVPEVAVQLDLERQPVQRIVDRLLDIRFVVRATNPRSLKSHKISLTALGRTAFDRVLEGEGKILRRVARQVDADDLEVTIKLIAQVTAAFSVGKGRKSRTQESSP